MLDLLNRLQWYPEIIFFLRPNSKTIPSNIQLSAAGTDSLKDFLLYKNLSYHSLRSKRSRANEELCVARVKILVARKLRREHATHSTSLVRERLLRRLIIPRKAKK